MLANQVIILPERAVTFFPGIRFPAGSEREPVAFRPVRSTEARKRASGRRSLKECGACDRNCGTTAPVETHISPQRRALVWRSRRPRRNRVNSLRAVIPTNQRARLRKGSVRRSRHAILWWTTQLLCLCGESRECAQPHFGNMAPFLLQNSG